MVTLTGIFPLVRPPDNIGVAGTYPSSMNVIYEHGAAKRIGGVLGYSTTLSSANTVDVNTWIAVTGKSGGGY